MSRKNKKFSNKTNHVANYLQSVTNSEKTRYNLRRNKAPFFYAPTITPTLTIFGEIRHVRTKKKLGAKAYIDNPTIKTSLGSLDTSGITAPKSPQKKIKKAPKNVKNEGAFLGTAIVDGQLMSRKTLVKRARAKYYTDKLIKPMYYWALQNGSPLLQQYRNVLSCNTSLMQDGDTLKGSYCSNKACQVCSRIRTARLIDAYQSPIELYSDSSGGADFVTLTLRNCKGEDLKAIIREMIKEFTLINRKLRERMKLETWGVRQLEVTYNKRRNDYHPHFHIVCNAGYGRHFVNMWLAKFADRADRKAQDVEKFDGDYNELFKYATKIVDVSKKKKNQVQEVDQETGKKVARVNLKALDTILQALTGVRVTQPFGDLAKIKVNEDLNKENKAQAYNDLPTIPPPAAQYMTVVNDNGELVEEWVEEPPPPLVRWRWVDNDWYFEGVKECEALTGYVSNENIMYKFYSK